MNHSVMNAKFGFARLNSILGSSAVQSPCPYVWEESAVFLMNAQFDESAFRYEKLTELFSRDLSLTFAEIEVVYDLVIGDHSELMTRISYALPSERGELEQELNYHLNQAIAHVEHQNSLKKSRSNIINARSLDNGWMSYDDVNQMMQLGQKRRFSAPEKAKFVNRNRH